MELVYRNDIAKLAVTGIINQVQQTKQANGAVGPKCTLGG
jgi:hypothetical protein